MSAVIEALVNGSALVDDAPLDEIIELGKRALREKMADELALDLLALDGVQLPLNAPALPVDGKVSRTAPCWLRRLRGRLGLPLHEAAVR